jgi:hypothetical protein
MPESNELLSAGAQLIGMPLAGPESFSQQQLDYLKRALGLDETVLYSGLKANGDGGSATYNLSELPTNFQIIKVYCCASDNTFPASQTGNCGMAFFEWDTTMYTPPSTGFRQILMASTLRLGLFRLH